MRAFINLKYLVLTITFVLILSGCKRDENTIESTITLDENATEVTTTITVPTINTSDENATESTTTITVPILNTFIGLIDENTTSGTSIGKISINNGGSTITALTLSGVGASEFNITTNGLITVSSTANLDYEIAPFYELQAVATNSVGNSIAVDVIIIVTNEDIVADSTISFSSDAVTTVIEGQTYTYNIIISESEISDTLIITAPTKPAWLNFTDNGNGTATLTAIPSGADVGTHNMTLRVANTAGAYIEQTFIVTVLSATATSFNVTATASNGGSIFPLNTIVNNGESASFTITPDSNYSIESTTGCDGSLSGTTYTTDAIFADCNVSISFTISSFTGYCGDGLLEAANEECDDGNNFDGDGCDANCITEEVISRFVLMDFEDDVLHDQSWLLSQPDGHIDFFVGPKNDSGANLLTLGIGEGRNGGNAMVVESTNATMGLPGFWLFKSSNAGSYAARLRDENAYMLPYGQKVNRLSFWIKYQPGFRVENSTAQPPKYPNHQNLVVGTYHFDPRRIETSAAGNGVVESDNWHFYHQVFIRHDKANGDWINVVVNQLPQHQRSNSGITPPNNPTALAGGYWELLTRFYVDNLHYFADPEIAYPVKMWVDDIEFFYVEEEAAILIEFQNIPDQPTPGEGAFDINIGVASTFFALLSNTGANEVCGVITDTSRFDAVLTDSNGNSVLMDNYCLSSGASEIITLTIHPGINTRTGRDEYIGLSFTAHDQIISTSESTSVSFSSPYVERRWRPQLGSQDAVVSGDHFRVMLLAPPANQAPVLDLIADINVTEGGTIIFNPTATDPNNDILTFSYSGWMTNNNYVTTSADVGTHTVTVTVSDGTLSDTQVVSVTVNDIDTTAPTLSSGAPTGALATGTTSTILSLTTDKIATCRYTTTPGTLYSSMTNTFTTTGSSSHSNTITGLTDGNTYLYYVRCIDEAGNQNAVDYLISFSIANNTTPAQLGNYWLFYGDSETGGRSGEVYTKSQATAFETIWSSTFGTPPRSHINGVGGSSLFATSGRYNNRNDRDEATFINFQESGTQSRTGQETATEFAETFETFVRKIVTESPNAIISTETAYSFLSDERWVPYNDAMRLKIELLAQEGITIYVAEVDRNIKELINQTSFYDVALADGTHYTGLGNLMVAISIYAALGFDVTSLDLSGVPASEVNATNKQLVIDIATQ